VSEFLEYPSHRRGVFRPLATLGRTTLTLLWIMAGFSVLFGVFNVITIIVPGLDLDEPMVAPSTDQIAFAVTAAIAGCGYLCFFIATAIAFLMWLYRANANLHALGVPRLKFNPGWSVGWWFIPIMQLFKPLLAVRELWQASDPHLSPDGDWELASGASLVGWWWGIGLANMVFQPGIGFLVAEASIPTWINHVLGILGVVLDISAVLLAIVVVGRITARIERLPQLPQFAGTQVQV
jgi:hypothetical protein